MMTAEEFVLSILAKLPQRTVEGKKRLQKLSYFMFRAGVNAPIHFSIRDFGPFSTEVARSADYLSVIGLVKEKEIQKPGSNFYTIVYELREEDAYLNKDFPEFAHQLLLNISKYPTVVLEVAATVNFFEMQGNSIEDAWRKTKEIKPTKTTLFVRSEASSVLDLISF